MLLVQMKSYYDKPMTRAEARGFVEHLKLRFPKRDFPFINFLQIGTEVYMHYDESINRAVFMSRFVLDNLPKDYRDFKVFNWKDLL